MILIFIVRVGLAIERGGGVATIGNVNWCRFTFARFKLLNDFIGDLILRSRPKHLNK